MDNRVTRKRLSDFLAYEWIFVIIICVLSIVVWELVYMVGEVRLTVGQNFKFYYDQTIDNKDGKLYSLIEEKSISYDILSLDYEQLSEKYNVLSSRLVLKEGDILITDCKQDYTQPEDGSQPQPLQVRLKSAVDNLYGYSFNQMLIDAQTYLRDNFIKDDKVENFNDIYYLLQKMPDFSSIPEDKKNYIWNFALLDSTTNEEYQNSPFPVKRICVLAKERG